MSDGEVDEIIKQYVPERILSIHFALFGFSRGAALARAFAIMLQKRCKQVGAKWHWDSPACPADIYFMRLWDTVASVGLPASSGVLSFRIAKKWLTLDEGLQKRRTAPDDGITPPDKKDEPQPGIALGYRPGAMPAPALPAGHMGWGDDLRLPPMTLKCVHFTAGHEVRNWFPLDSVREGVRLPVGKRRRNFEDAVSRLATRPYLTLLNLRTAEVVGGQVRTEQVYVHSKLLIADDRVVILGSANINDRSLAGGRDSELAVYMTDLATMDAPLDGKRPVKVRKLAHMLRVELWKKHFALAGANSIVQPASALSTVLDKPHDPATWAAIQAVAGANLEAYAAAFPWTPKNKSSIWPVWPANLVPAGPKNNSNEEKYLAYKRAQDMGKPFAERMPFSDEFWKNPPKATPPSGIKGFICALPIEWTAGQNNHPRMNMILLTEMTHPSVDRPRTALASNGEVDDAPKSS